MSSLPPTPPQEPDPVLGQVIRRLREERGLSRADLAARARVEGAMLARLEDGTIDPPWTAVEAIAAGLGVSVESIASAVVAQEADAP